MHFFNGSNTTSVTPSSDDVTAGYSKSTNWDSFADSDFVLILYGVICVVGILGNLLVAFVLLRVPSLRSNTSDILVHLALVDFIVCLLVIPFKIVATMGPSEPNTGFFGQLRCKLYVSQFLFWVCAVVSVLCLVTINLERFVAIVYPHKYKKVFTRRNKYLMMVSCWVIGALCKIFILFLYREDEIVGCHFVGWPDRTVQAVVGVYNFTANFVAPFIVMVAAQWKVISTLKRQVQILNGRMASSPLTEVDRRKMWQLRASRMLVRTLMTFVITFAMCWAPNQFMFLLYNIGVSINFASPVYHVGIILAVCNSCVNPILYTMTNKPFREGIRKAFRVGTASVGNTGPEQGSSTNNTATTRFGETTKNL
ncbi:allatostatin-A receptor-like [Asterias amurensis]|uniref:allatostatin-A receptor-like n=1 Tax=Asterias amurensis TaxID=7602 RepID=UPI003AB63F74